MAVWSVHSLVLIPSVQPVERYRGKQRSKGSFDHEGLVLLRGQRFLIELNGRASVGPEAKVGTTSPLSQVRGLACGGWPYEVDSRPASHQQLIAG